MTVEIQERLGGMRILGSGGGGKGGGGSARTPREEPDSLHSISYAALLDVISNGEVAGPVHEHSPLRDIFLDGTPIQNDDGTLNFRNVQVEVRHGTQNQEHIPGFPASASVTQVGVDVKQSQPWSQTITNPDLSAVRVTLGWPVLVRAIESGEKIGDRVGTSVEYAIDLSVGGGTFQSVLVATTTGKGRNYERTHRIELPPSANGWTVRVRRLTPDSTSDTLANDMRVQAYAEVIDGKFRYPMTAIAGIKIDAEQFSSIPTRAYRWRGQIIRVPSNYDPIDRTYSGVWDGTFKRAWSNNPAWVFYDILTNKLYGLGDRIDASMIDRYALYQIAAYCDQMVPDGMGGTEPRFVCNTYLQGRADALRVVNDLASAFRGMAYWANGQVIGVADRPSDPVYTYANANVSNGRFEYTGADASTRKTVALVSWNDPTDFYRSKVEVVNDDDGIRRYGIRKAEIKAFGCTSRGQAQRVGLYHLYTSRMETGGLTFSVGLDGVIPQPGDIIKIADRNRAGRHIGGRIKRATPTTVTLDRDHPIKVGDVLTVNMPNGQAQSRPVQLVSDRVITVAPGFDGTPSAESVWAVDADDLVTQHARVISVKEGDGITFDIAAVEHHPGKFDAIDHNVRLDPLPVSVVPPRTQNAPTNVQISEFATFHQGTTRHTAEITWDAPEHAVAYDVQWRRDNGDWVQMSRTGTTTVEIPDIYAGGYLVRVRAINGLDVPSLWAYSDLTELDGIVGEPPVVSSLATSGIVFGIEVNWVLPSSPNIIERTELRYSKTPSFADSILLGEFSYPTNTHTLMNLSAGAQLYFWARLIDKNGMAGAWYPTDDGVRGQASADAHEILSYLEGQIDVTELTDWLKERINAIPGLVDDMNALGQQVAELLGGNDWDPDTDYTAGTVVFFDGAMYRAVQDVPAGTPVTDGAFWRYIGDYASIGDAVSGLAISVSEMRAQITDIDGEVTAIAGQTSTMVAQLRDDDGEGRLEDVLNEHESRAWIARNEQAIVTNQRAQAEVNTQLVSQIGESQSAIEEVYQTIVDVDEGLAASWSIKTQIVSGQGEPVVAGLNLGVKQEPGQPSTSHFSVAADVFRVINLTNGVATTPFVIQGGQVFLRQALIGDGWITNAMIGNTIQSNNFVNNQAGWQINKSGTFQVNGAGGSGRLVINNGVIQVFDANNRLRVRMGIW